MTTGTVQIPPDHFTKRVRAEYSDPLTTLVREHVQNSVDAGATRLDFITSDDGLVVRDNGRGIQADRMVEALLTLGGTVKDGQSIGGYGAAKEILLFAHESYEIRTLNSRVTGHVLQYTMETVPECFAGAEFAVRFSPSFNYDRSSFCGRAREYLASCQIACEVRLDGERVTTDLRARRIDLPFAHGRVLCKRLESGLTSDHILVRVHGLTMFQCPVRAIAKRVIVELEGDVRSMLTANRDGLRYPFRTALGEVAAAVTIDPKSFDRKRAQRTIYPGRESNFYARLQAQVSDAFRGLLPSVRVEMLVSELQSSIKAGANVDGLLGQACMEAASATGRSLSAEANEGIRKLVENFGTDFVVSIENTDLRVAPRSCRPSTMGRGYKQIAQLWKWAIDQAIQAAGIHLSYRIGFVLDPEKLGYFNRNDDGADILINPEIISKITNRRERFMRVLVLSAHELAHAAHSYHDEEFTRESERILIALLARVESQTKALRESRKVLL